MVHNLLANLAFFGGRWSHHSLEPVVCCICVWSVLESKISLVLRNILTSTTSAKSTQIVCTSIKPSCGHRRLPLLSRQSQVCIISSRSQISIEDLVDRPGLESFNISISLIESICTHDATILILNFLDQFYFQLVIQKGISLPGLNQLDDVLLQLLVVLKSIPLNPSWCCRSLSRVALVPLTQRLFIRFS